MEFTGMRPNRLLRVFGGTALLVLGLARTSMAEELATETIQLQEGWNFVWLNLDPKPAGTDVVLQGVDLQTIWAFQPNEVPPAVGGDLSGGRWFFYDKDVPDEINTLRFLQGQRGYLIKMNSADQLTVAGRPVPRSHAFHAHVSNLFGALGNPGSSLPLTFERFFAHPNAQGKIRTDASGTEHEVFTLAGESLVRLSPSDRIERHVAYWINVVQSFDYRGPIGVTAGLDGIGFGREVPRRTLLVEVPVRQTARSVLVRALPCVRIGGLPFCPGDLDASWLEYLDPNRDPLQPLSSSDWLPLSGGVVLTVGPNESVSSLEIRARRDRATVAVAARGISETSFEALVEISDESGGQILIPSDLEVEPIFGCWIGRATMTHVSAHPDIQKVGLQEAEAVPFQMTLILDVPDPTTKPGQPVRLLDSVSLPDHRDGVNIARRLHATLFDRTVELAQDVPLDPFGFSGTLTGVLAIQPADSHNPYRHRYNPEHGAGYAVTRQITLQFERTTGNVAEELLGLDGTFGPNRLTGTYTEVITGLSPDPINVRGSFVLDRLTEEAVGEPPGAAPGTQVSTARQKREKRSP
jgi:hypothetical protein